MSKFTSEMVDDLANKLLIGLTKEENKMVLDEFDIIESNVEKVTKIKDITNVKPMTHCLDDFNFNLREDKIEPSIPIEELLQNCDDTEGSEVVVPKVVG